MRGFTLIEILITLIVAGIIINAAVPALYSFHQRTVAQQDIAQLHQLLHSSREQAMHRGERITLCPDNGTGQCGSDWNKLLLAFNDQNNNQQMDSDETLLQQTTAANPSALRTYTGKVISFNESGFSDTNTGSLGYCMASDQPITASFIISRLGRIRHGTDSDGDGIVELASQQNVPCPI